MRRPPALDEGILVVTLGVSAFGFGAVASRFAEPVAAARSTTPPGVHQPVTPAAVAMAGTHDSVRVCAAASQSACAVRGPDANLPARHREGEALPSGRCAVWGTLYEPQDARIELVHTASAARGRPLALLYIEQDWEELVGTGSGSLEHSARPRALAESPGA